MNPKLRFIALSATIPNASDIADWINARLIESNWRPVPLKAGRPGFDEYGEAVLIAKNKGMRSIYLKIIHQKKPSRN